MNNSYQEQHKQALLEGLFKRIRNRIKFLNHKKYLLIDGEIKKSDENQLQKIREDILK